MGLFDDISDFFGGASSISGGGFLSTALDILAPGPVASGFQPISYMPSYGFGSGDMGDTSPNVYQTMSGVPAIAGSAMQAARPILFKIAQQLGLRALPSVSRAMGIVRRLAKYLSPAATAAALGITASELATLMTISARKRRRSMNPANTKALRRSMRRLQSFDKLAHRVSAQLSHVGGTRRRSRGRSCNTCRKSPCRC